MPEPGLTTANTVIDFSQGAVTASTENTHLAIQGEGFFLLATPETMDLNPASGGFGATLATANARFFLTRDGEFRTDQNGLLVHSSGLYLVSVATGAAGGKRVLWYETTFSAMGGSPIRCVYNNVDNTGTLPSNRSVRLTDFLANTLVNDLGGAGIVGGSVVSATIKATLGKQSLSYSRYGSTIYDLNYKADTGGVFTTNQYNASLSLDNAASSDNTVLSKSLEASNASMTQSVPELSLAQKLFSALTKVLQTKQTNVDGVLNLVR
jgi:flagellar hook protein FlgE